MFHEINFSEKIEDIPSVHHVSLKGANKPDPKTFSRTSLGDPSTYVKIEGFLHCRFSLVLLLA